MRANWNVAGTYFFVSILKEYNAPRHRAQNGWTKEAWNSMTQRINDKFVSANFVMSQLKDREQRLKKDYNAVKAILSKSGFGWDINLKMASTIDGLWSELPDHLQKWKNKSFPYYDDLHDIYNGKIAEGKHCRRSSEKANKIKNKFLEEDCEEISTPSPTIPVMQGSFTDLIHGGFDLNIEDGFDFDIHDSQYRATTEEQTAKETQCCSQTLANFIEVQESQKRKAAAACASTQIPVRQERDNKKSKRNDNTMNELIVLRREELEAYKELIEKKFQLKRTQMQQSDPVNDPYSMAKCMDKLKSQSLSQPNFLKAINFLKGDREAREIFMCCDEESLAEAYIKGSISN